MKGRRSVQHHFILMLLGSTLVSVGLFLYDAWRNSSFDFAFMLWNLFLAWLPLIFALWLTRILRQRLWSSWYALIVTLLWFIFLPNSFYVITDFIHLATASRVDLLYDAVMLTSFIYTGVILGFSSLYLVHLQLLKRVSRQSASVWIGGILLACSAAMAAFNPLGIATRARRAPARMRAHGGGCSLYPGTARRG